MKPNKPKAPMKANPLPKGSTMGKGPEVAPDEDRRWKAEDGMRTLMRAEEIKRDGPLMRDIESHRKQKMRDMDAIKITTSRNTMKMKCD